MHLSASPASIAPLSAAFIAPEQPATAAAESTTDFAQVFANLGAATAGAASGASPGSSGVNPEVAVPAAAPQTPGRFSPAGRKPFSARGEAVVPGAPRAKSAPAREPTAEEIAFSALPTPSAPVAVPPAVLAGGLAATGAAEEQPAGDSLELPAGLVPVAVAQHSESRVSSDAAPRRGRQRLGAIRVAENGGMPAAGAARWITPGSGMSAARSAEGQLAAASVATGAREVESLPTESRACAPEDLLPPECSAPLAGATPERGMTSLAPNPASGNQRAAAPFTPAAVQSFGATREQAVAPLPARVTPAGETAEPAVPFELGRPGWIAGESSAVPLAGEQQGMREEEALTPSGTGSEAQDLDLLVPRTIDSLRPAALRALIDAPQAPGRAVPRVENIADHSAKTARAVVSDATVPLKHIESSFGKALTDDGSVVGTRVAKTQAFMPVPPSILAATDASFSPRLDLSPSEAAAMSPATDSKSAAAASAPMVAGRAVEAVLSAADRLAAGDRSSVRLEFALGESELSVRVALRDNAVRATFQTDSPELRAALAHEWQVMTAESGGRALQFAAPTFQSGPGEASSQGALAGDSFRHQREGHPQHAGEREFAGRSNAPQGNETRAPNPAGVGTDRGLAALPAYSLHLHTLA